MLLELHPHALAELAAHVQLLERERDGYGRLFYAEVTRRVAQASRFPRSGAPALGLEPHRDVRCFTLRRFPFRVITALARDKRIVVAIAHHRRSPQYWRDRLT